MAKITKISYTHKPTSNGNHKFFIYSEGFDPKKEVLIFKISYNFYYPVYNHDKKHHYIEINKNEFDFEQGKSSSDRMVRLFCYQFEQDKTNYVATGSIKIYKSTTTASVAYWGYSALISASVTADKPWVKGLTITSVLGPYQDNKLVTKIDLSKPVKYAALTNKSGLQPGQLLAAQWSYSINGGEKAKFYSKIEWSRDSETNKIIMQFKPIKEWDGKNIAVYAYFMSPSEEVSSKAPGFVTVKPSPASSSSKPATTSKPTAKKLIWSSKVTKEFENKVVQICGELWGEARKYEMANGLMAVMAVESARTFKAHVIEGLPLKKDPKDVTKDDFKKIVEGKNSSRAVGLIQFTQAALEYVGDFKSGSGFDKLHEVKLEYAQMGELNQLDKVKTYFEKAKDKIKNPQDIYLKVFAPVGVGKDPNFVLYQSGTKEYNSNSSVDTETGNNNGKIERWEILKRYFDLYEEGKKYMSGNIAEEESKENDGPKDINLYKINLDKLTCTRMSTVAKKDFKFEIYKDDKLLKTYIATANKHGFVKIPETGPNWGRYGTRDADKTDGDNWATPAMYAAVLAFFYSLKDIGIKETLYYNDLSAFDGVTNLGHETHKTGKDIDIRYPGCTNKAGSQYWTVSRDYYGSQKIMDEKMTLIYSLAVKLNMTNNYHYKTFPNTRNKAFSVHKDHFHLGLK